VQILFSAKQKSYSRKTENNLQNKSFLAAAPTTPRLLYMFLPLEPFCENI